MVSITSCTPSLKALLLLKIAAALLKSVVYLVISAVVSSRRYAFRPKAGMKAAAVVAPAVIFPSTVVSCVTCCESASAADS